MSLDVGQLFERYHPVVFRRCLALLRHEQDAEEAVQEVFVAALSGLGRFRLQASPLTWLYAVATRHCLQRLRNARTRSLKAVLLVSEEGHAPERSLAVELEDALRGLDLDELELVVLAWRDELTQEEIAAVTRQSRKTVGKKLARLATKLRGRFLPRDEALPAGVRDVSPAA